MVGHPDIRSFPKIMGIVNITSDSFSDGGMYVRTDDAVQHALHLIESGADIVDFGGESTRPNAKPVSLDSELRAVIPVIEQVRRINEQISISIDTTKIEVAKAAIDAGVDIINDISGLNADVRLAELAAEKKKSLVIMHMQGTPRTMQLNPQYENVVEEVYSFLESKVTIAREIGVMDIYIDVGIGFGKTIENNIELLKNLDYFSNIHCKMLLGISRKSFIGSLLDIQNPKERDVPTALIYALLLKSKIDVIRVHDVELLNRLRVLYNTLANN